jgi:hypothetical protein
MTEPSRSRKGGFWLLLGLTSTAFAEVLFPTTAFDLATMALFAVPIYLLHAVVLAGVVYRAERVDYPALYLAGVLLGLYESYVTKVVWAPIGDRPFVEVGGVYVGETLGLVLFWHPLLAFVLPVTVVEAVATASRRSLVPPLANHRHSRAVVLALVGYVALFQGSLGGPVRSLGGNLVALASLLAALALWRRSGGHRYTMRALLPRGRTLGVLAATLCGVYVVLGSLIRPRELPTSPWPHLPIVGLYLTAGVMLWVLGRRPGPEPATGSVQVTWRRILVVAGAFVLGAAMLGLVGSPLSVLVFLAYYAVAVVVGIASVRTVVRALRE